MTTTYKNLGQVSPSATTLTTLYTVAASTSAIASTIAVCNQNTTSITYRVAVRVAGAGIAAAHYLAYDVVLPGNSSDFLTLGVTLAATDVVSVYASATGVSFNLSGCENT